MTTQLTVRVYTKPNCMQCRLTKTWLAKRGVPFIEDDATDPQTIAAAQALRVMAAPIVTIGDVVFGGFRPDLLEQHVSTKEKAA